MCVAVWCTGGEHIVIRAESHGNDRLHSGKRRLSFHSNLLSVTHA